MSTVITPKKYGHKYSESIFLLRNLVGYDDLILFELNSYDGKTIHIKFCFMFVNFIVFPQGNLHIIKQNLHVNQKAIKI